MPKTFIMPSTHTMHIMVVAKAPNKIKKNQKERIHDQMPNTVKKKNKSNISGNTSTPTFTIHHTTNKSLLAQHKKLAPLIRTLFSPHSPFITCRALDPTNATIDPTTSVALAPGSIAMLFSAEDYATYLPVLSYVMPSSSINKQTPAGVKIIAQTSEYVYLILEHPYLFLAK